jgi:hypothetical protein
MTFDPREDKRQMEEWVSTEEPDQIDLDLVAEKIINGFEQCEEYCFSRNNCGDDMCYCIRANFPTPKHYDTYKEMMLDASKIVAIRILSNVIS